MSAGDRASSSDTENVATTTEAAVSDKIVQLGRRLGMNTELRRSVFYAIITSDVCFHTTTLLFDHIYFIQFLIN